MQNSTEVVVLSNKQIEYICYFESNAGHCLERQKTMSKLLSHRIDEHNDYTYLSCVICSKEFNRNVLFSNYKTLAKHHKKYHGKWLPLQIPSSSKWQLPKQLPEQRKWQMDVFECKYCKMSNINESIVENHESFYHTSNNVNYSEIYPKVVTCELCEIGAPKIYNGPSAVRNLKRHIQQYHSQTNQIVGKCSRCNIFFEEAEKLDEHCAKCHNFEFHCKIEKCCFKTNHRSSLKRHTNSMHPSNQVVKSIQSGKPNLVPVLENINGHLSKHKEHNTTDILVSGRPCECKEYHAGKYCTLYQCSLPEST